jgi:hypothetical protein
VSIEQRLERLERQNLILRGLIVGIVAVGGLVVTLGAMRQATPKKIEAEEFSLVSGGKVLASLKPSSTHVGAKLEFLDLDAKTPFIELGRGANGPGLVIKEKGNTGVYVVNHLKLNDGKDVDLTFSIGNQTDSLPILSMLQGKAGLAVNCYKDRTELDLSNRKGEFGARLTAPN